MPAKKPSNLAYLLRFRMCFITNELTSAMEFSVCYHWSMAPEWTDKAWRMIMDCELNAAHVRRCQRSQPQCVSVVPTECCNLQSWISMHKTVEIGRQLMFLCAAALHPEAACVVSIHLAFTVSCLGIWSNCGPRKANNEFSWLSDTRLSVALCHIHKCETEAFHSPVTHWI